MRIADLPMLWIIPVLFIVGLACVVIAEDVVGDGELIEEKHIAYRYEVLIDGLERYDVLDSVKYSLSVYADGRKIASNFGDIACPKDISNDACINMVRGDAENKFILWQEKTIEPSVYDRSELIGQVVVVDKG